MSSPVASGLPERLKRETRALHTAAERAGVMGEMLHGRVRRATYCALLRNLHAIYEALEQALDAHAAEPWVKPLWQAALRREPSLARDLDALHGGDWRHEIVLASAAQQYVERLHALARDFSPALVGHAYVRYLGDLHGGQIVGRIVREQLALGREAGTRFYAFGEDDEVQQLRTAFRTALTHLPVGASATEGIVAEACWAFELHRQLFEELQRPVSDQG